MVVVGGKWSNGVPRGEILVGGLGNEERIKQEVRDVRNEHCECDGMSVSVDE